MTPENFTYWLQGYLELSKAKQLNEEQVEEVKKHLALVFVNQTDLMTVGPDGKYSFPTTAQFNSFFVPGNHLITC